MSCSLSKDTLFRIVYLPLRKDSSIPADTWPVVWRHVAWLLVALVVLICSFFVILYSMQWGKDISEEWLSSFMLSFVQSLFVVDPFKVSLVITVQADRITLWKEICIALS